MCGCGQRIDKGPLTILDQSQLERHISSVRLSRVLNSEDQAVPPNNIGGDCSKIAKFSVTFLRAVRFRLLALTAAVESITLNGMFFSTARAHSAPIVPNDCRQCGGLLELTEYSNTEVSVSKKNLLRKFG